MARAGVIPFPVQARASVPGCNVTAQYLLAGRAVFTASTPSGEHYTYKIKTWKRPGVRGDYELWFMVFLLTDGDKWIYIGALNPQSLHLFLTRKSRVSEQSAPVRVFRWACTVIAGRHLLREGYKIEHSGRCGKCGRELTTPESIARGIGPHCAEHGS